MSLDYEPEIEYTVTMTIDGEEVATISGYSEDSVLEDWYKLDRKKDEWFDEMECSAELRWESEEEDE